MSLTLIAYLIMVIGGLHDLLEGVTFFLIIGILASVCCAGYIYDTEWEADISKPVAWVKRFSCTLGAVTLVLILLPDKEDCYVLLAAQGVDLVIENGEITQIFDKSVDLIGKTIDKKIEEMGTEKK